jgi:CheY-like chemotaxis protein
MINEEQVKKLLKIAKNLKILYVEDDINLQNNMLNILENFFSDIYVADNGKEGLDIFKDNINTESNFDIVISDLDMPEIDGFEMCSQILETKPDQKIIITTAFATKENINKLVEKNIEVLKVLEKPIKMNQFIIILLELLKK